MSSAESTPGEHCTRVARWSLLIALLLGVVLRLLQLDADPHYYAWFGHLTDEGRWVESARSLALYGTWSDYGFDLHLLLAPLYQLVHYPVLALAGVSFWSTRLPTAVAGCVLLALVWRRLRNRVHPSALFLGIAVLVTQADLVMLSRIAVPETALMLVQALVFFAIFSGVEMRRKIGLAGVLTLLGIGVKATMASTVLGFALVVFGIPRDRATAGSAQRRLADAALYVAVVAGPLAIAALFALLAGFPLRDYLPPYIPLLGKLFEPSSLFGLVSFGFDSLLAPTFNVLCLSAWLGGLVFWMVPRARRDGIRWRLFVGSGFWAIGCVVPLQILGYFPHRYQVHALLPLALMAVATADALVSVGARSICDALDRRRRCARFAAGALAGLPVSAIAAPLVLAALIALGADPDRLQAKLLAWALSLGIIAAAMTALSGARRAWMFLLSFPLVFGVTWLASSLTPVAGAFWSAGSEPAWGVTVAVASAFWGVGAAVARRGFRFSEACGALLAGWAYLSVWLLAIAPAYVAPHYTIRDASRDLGRLTAGAASVTSHSVDALFLENDVPFRSYYRIDPIQDKADFFVSGFDDDMFFMFREMLDAEYTPVKVYPLYLSPEFRRHYRARGRSPEDLASVTVYQRIEAAAGKPPEGARDASRSAP